MKIRLGFVSNSSSSSFCICGVCLNNSKIDELKDKILDDFIKNNSLEKLIEKIKSESKYSCNVFDRGMGKNTPNEKDEKDEKAVKEVVKKMFDDLGWLFSMLNEKIENIETFSTGSYDDYVYMGASLTGIGMDETLRQYQDKIKKELEKMGISVENFGIHEEAIYNG